jgi:uncharacterized protein (AIM24 family)
MAEAKKPVLAKAGTVAIVIAAVIAAVATAYMAPRVAASFSSASAPQPVQQAQAGTRFVVVDSRRIIDASLKSVSGEGMTPEKAAAAGKAFAIKLNDALEAYKASGAIVLNSGTILAWPGSVDVTDEVARKVGVDLH